MTITFRDLLIDQEAERRWNRQANYVALSVEWLRPGCMAAGGLS